LDKIEEICIQRQLKLILGIGMARPSKLTKKTQNKLLKGIKAGLTYERACQLAGIYYSTYRNWILWGEQEKERVNRELQIKYNEALEANKLKNTEQRESFLAKALKQIKPNKFFEFLELVKKTESELEEYNLSLIEEAAEGNIINLKKKKKQVLADGSEVETEEINQAVIKGRWQAAAWLLERKYPERYALNIKHEAKIEQEQKHLHLHKHEEIDTNKVEIIENKDDENAAILRLLLETGYFSEKVVRLVEDKTGIDTNKEKNMS
jgi:hypothetical protein